MACDPVTSYTPRLRIVKVYVFPVEGVINMVKVSELVDIAVPIVITTLVEEMPVPAVSCANMSGALVHCPS